MTQKKFPHTLVWVSLASLLLLLAIILPPSWNTDLKKIATPQGATELTIFSPAIIQLSEALHQGGAVKLNAEMLATYKPYVQARRLAELAPFVREENDRALTILKEFENAINQQHEESARQALRNERDRQLQEALPRIEPQAIRNTLSTLEVHYQSVLNQV